MDHKHQTGIARAPLPARLARPLEEFLSTEALGGVLLLAATAAALVWANAAPDSYADFWSRRIAIDIGAGKLDLDLTHWVNDALMAVFFYVVGLEIKRELLRGELAGPRKAALPVAAAIGGMVAPALLYITVNAGGDGADGWAIPMATDIAFAVGVLALLGPRVPLALRVFLVALAIVDDMGAITVIALFYTDSLEPAWLALAALMLAATYGLGRAGFRDMSLYIVIAVVAWIAVHESGVHATVTGVALGLLTPLRAQFGPQKAYESARQLVDDMDRGGPGADEARSAALRDLEELARESQPVLDRLEHALHPWTSYVIVPVFALANAGIQLDGGAVGDALDSRIGLGVLLGLVVGKPLGILLASWLVVRAGVAALPDGVSWPLVAGASVIAGIGFTMSIFITGLAFDSTAQVAEAKTAILFASATMGIAGLAVLLLAGRKPDAGHEKGPV